LDFSLRAGGGHVFCAFYGGGGSNSSSVFSFAIYGGLTAGVVLYATLFGLSAAAYRALYLQPSLAGDRQ
jgi:hypothetical protein